jgi:hypothetical protein
MEDEIPTATWVAIRWHSLISGDLADKTYGLQLFSIAYSIQLHAQKFCHWALRQQWY